MYPHINEQVVQRGYNNDANSILGVKRILSFGDTVGTQYGHPSAVPVFLDSCPTVNPATCVSFPPLGIHEVTASTGFSAYLYPNPYQDNTTIHIDVSGYSNFVITIYDVVGHLILQKKISTDTSFDVPLSDFNEGAGLYLIQVSDSHSHVTLKLIKL